MNDFVIIIILGIPIIVFVILVTKQVAEGFSFRDWFRFITLLLFYIISGISAFFTLKLSIIFGLAHYLLVVSCCILLLRAFKKASDLIAGIAVITPIIIFSIAIPFSIFPYFASRTESKTAEAPKKISVTPIHKGLNTIKGILDNLEKQVGIESKNINSLRTVLVKDIENKNEQLKNTQIELERLSKEVEHYKTLASLSEEQTQAVIRALNSSKYFDYLAGFIIGLIISGTFFLIQTFVSRKNLLRTRIQPVKEQKKNKEKKN